MPDPETPAIAETLVQQTQEEQMLREAVGSLTPQCRSLWNCSFSKLRRGPMQRLPRNSALRWVPSGLRARSASSDCGGIWTNWDSTDVQEGKKSSREELILQLAQLESEPARIKFLSRYKSLAQREVFKQLSDLVLEKIRVDTRVALHLADAALLIARKAAPQRGPGSCLRTKANALHASGDNRSAVEHHEQAFKIYEVIGDQKEAARTLSSSIQPLILLANTIAPLRPPSARVKSSRGSAKRGASQASTTMWAISFTARIDLKSHRALRARLQTLSEFQDWERVAITLHNMAMCLISLNDFPRSLDCYQKSRALCEQYGMPLLRDQADYNIAYLYYFRGEYSRAIEMLFATRRACEVTGDAYHFALCHLDLSEIYLELNLSEEAREMAQEGFLRFEKLGMGYEAAKTLANEAIAYGQQGKTVQALERFAKAREMFAREKNLVWPWLLDLYQGLLLFHEGATLEARRLCAGAAGFFDQTLLSGKAVLAHLLLARIAFQLGELAVAESETETAVAKIARLQTPVLAYQAHFLRGQLAQGRGERSAALAAYSEARGALETLRSRLHSEELKISFGKKSTSDCTSAGGFLDGNGSSALRSAAGCGEFRALRVPRYTPRGPQSARLGPGQAARGESVPDRRARALQTRNLGDGSFRLRFRDCQLSELERDAREEKMCEHCFSGEQRLIEKSGCTRAEPARLKVAPFVEQEQSLYKSSSQGHTRFFSRANISRALANRFERLLPFSLAGRKRSLRCQRFCGFVAHAQLFKPQEAFLRHFPRFFAQV